MVSVNLKTLNWKHLIWIVYLCIFAFAIPFFFFHLIKTPVDIYNLVFLALSAAALFVYRKYSSFKIRMSLNSGWALGSILAVFIGLGFVSVAMAGSQSLSESLKQTDVAIVVWRGIIFGLSAGLIISAIPFVIVWRALAGVNPGRIRRFSVVLVAVFCVALVSTSYNLGMAGFDGSSLEKTVRKNIIASLPTMLSGNPLAAPIAGAFISASEIVKDHPRGISSPQQKEAIANKPGPDGGSD